MGEAQAGLRRLITVQYHDGGGVGLCLRVELNASRFWVQRITIRGKRCELGLDSPSLVALAQARAAAFENKQLIRAGGDPRQARRGAVAQLTFSEVRRSAARRPW